MGGGPPRPASPGWLLERGSRSPRSASPSQRSERRAGEPANPPWHSEKSWRSQGEPSRSLNSERGRAAWQAGGTGQALERKSRGNSLHPVGFGKGSGNSGVSQAGQPPRSLSPGRRTESTWRSQKEMSPPTPVQGTGRQRVKSGETLHLKGPGKASECGWQSLREKLPPSHAGRSTGSNWKGQGKPLRPTSPTRPPEKDWRGRGDAHQTQAWEKDWKHQEKPVCHADLMRQPGRDRKSPTRCLDVGLRPDDSWKRPESPSQQLEDDWKGPKHTQDTNNPEKPLESSWRNKRLLVYHVSRAGARGDGGTPSGISWQAQSGCVPWVAILHCPGSPGPLPVQGSHTACLALGEGRMLPPPGLHWEADAWIWETKARTHGFSSCFLPMQPQLGGAAFPLQSSAGSSRSPQPRLNASEKCNKVGARLGEW